MKKRHFAITFLITSIMLMSVLSEHVYAKDITQLKVGVAVAPSFKSIKGWKQKFKKRLAYASQIFEREFNVKLIPSAFMDWTPKNERTNTRVLLDELRENYPLHGADIVIGLARLPEMPDMTEINDLHVLGRAIPFSGYVMIRYPNDPLFKIQEETVLVHEIGHLFGAVHTDQRDTVMAPVVSKHIPTSFDESNREIIRLTKNVNFKEGVEVLDERTNRQLIGSYMRLTVHNQPQDFYHAMGFFYINLKQYDDAIKVWEKASKMDMDNSKLLYDLGVLYLQMGRYDKAIKSLSDTVAALSSPLERSQKASALNLLGEAYTRDGNLLAAYNALNRAQAIAPENVDVMINLAVVLLKRGQTDDAIKELESIITIEPNNAKAVSYLGNALYEAGKLNESLVTLERAIEIVKQRNTPQKDASTLYEIYGNLGAVYLKMKRNRQAITTYQTACKYFDSVRCHKQLGSVYHKLGMWGEATQELAGVVQHQKDDADAYGLLGVSLSKMGRNEQAIGVFKEGLRHLEGKAESAMLHRNMGFIYVQMRHSDLAEKEFRMAIQLDYANPQAHLGLAMAQLGKSNLMGAKSSLQTVLRINPKDMKARELLATVEKTIKETSRPGTVSIRGNASISN